MNESLKWKYAQEERERKFLLANNPIKDSFTKKRIIEDKYLHDSRLRLRKTISKDGVVYKLTKKILLEEASGPSINHWISTIYLSETEYQLFLPLAGNSLKKL